MSPRQKEIVAKQIVCRQKRFFGSGYLDSHIWLENYLTLVEDLFMYSLLPDVILLIPNNGT